MRKLTAVVKKLLLAAIAALRAALRDLTSCIKGLFSVTYPDNHSLRDREVS